MIQIVDGSAKGNINMFLRMGLRPLVINTAGFWDIPFTPEMNMTAGHSRHFMINCYPIIRKWWYWMQDIKPQQSPIFWWKTRLNHYFHTNARTVTLSKQYLKKRYYHQGVSAPFLAKKLNQYFFILLLTFISWTKVRSVDSDSHLSGEALAS